jgi:hypothetical protein
MIFKKRKTMKPDPAFTLAEFRTELERVINEAARAGARHYVLTQALEDAAQVIRIRHAACSPIL